MFSLSIYFTITTSSRITYILYDTKMPRLFSAAKVIWPLAHRGGSILTLTIVVVQFAAQHVPRTIHSVSKSGRSIVVSESFDGYIVIERVLYDSVVGFWVVPMGREAVRYGSSEVRQVNPACIFLEHAHVLFRYVCALVDRASIVRVTSQNLCPVPRMLRNQHRAATISPIVCCLSHWRGLLGLVHDSWGAQGLRPHLLIRRHGRVKRYWWSNRVPIGLSRLPYNLDRLIVCVGLHSSIIAALVDLVHLKASVVAAAACGRSFLDQCRDALARVWVHGKEVVFLSTNSLQSISFGLILGKEHDLGYHDCEAFIVLPPIR